MYADLKCSGKGIHIQTQHEGRRALCRIKLLSVTHGMVDTWMLTVQVLDKLSNLPDDMKWATNTHMTPFTLTFKA